MKSIHPFPARMAPDSIAECMNALPRGSTVLDPMCGSGVVLRQALLSGRDAIGVDLDPLAVLMSRVWAKRIETRNVSDEAAMIVEEAVELRDCEVSLPWIDTCNETQKFIHYWFAEEQARDLRCLSYVLHNRPSRRSRALNNLLWIALSRTIITKHVGASLAWDIPHSRPHKVRTKNDYNVMDGFFRSAVRVANVLDEESLPRNASIHHDDSRRLSRIRRASVDAVITSPPYLNAIDYLRGHKFSLVWMGHSIPSIRQLRAIVVGAERAPDRDNLKSELWSEIHQSLPNIKELPPRYQRIIKRYAQDSMQLMVQFKRVLKSKGKMILVLGDSCIRGRYIQNSRMCEIIADFLEFELTDEWKRQLETQKRYLPIISKNNTLENRMKHETIQVYSA